MASNDNTPIVQAVAVSEIRGADATPLLEAIPAEAVEYSPFATTEAVAADQRRASHAADMRGCRAGAGDAARAEAAEALRGRGEVDERLGGGALGAEQQRELLAAQERRLREAEAARVAERRGDGVDARDVVDVVVARAVDGDGGGDARGRRDGDARGRRRGDGGEGDDDAETTSSDGGDAERVEEDQRIVASEE